MIHREEIIGDDRSTWIYALCEPGGVTPRYVGKTVRGLSVRHKDHLRAAAKIDARYPVHRWIRRLYAAGSWSCIRALEIVEAGSDWAARERFWIERLRSQGHSLLNLTLGGDGVAGRRRPPEEIERIRAGKRTGGEFSCLACGGSFYRKRNEIARGHNRYCSRRCSNARHKVKAAS